jgi:hypothetical protein
MELRVVVVRHKGRSMVQRSRRVGVVAVVAVGRNRSRLVDEGSLTFQERNGEFLLLLLLLLFCGEFSGVEEGLGLWSLYRVGNVNYLDYFSFLFLKFY